jgi:hypothetical protein
MSQSQPSSVIQSLETVRERVKQRLMKVPEYRAFLAIENPIGEVADISDLVAHLQAAKQKILERLSTTREYRALLTVEKTIEDIAEILDVVGNDETFDAAPSSSKKQAETEAPASEAIASSVTQKTVPAIAVTAPPGSASPAIANRAAAVTESPETYSPVATDVAAAINVAGPHYEMPTSNPAERLSTLGLVEEWRLTAVAGEGKGEAGKAKVA